MRNVLIGIAITSLVGCTTPAPKNFDFPEWEPFGYDTLVEKVEELAGPDAINCGFVDALSGEKSTVKLADRKLAQSQICIDHAIKTKRPFKFGLVRIASTSYVWQMAIMTPELEFWSITYDYAIDGTGVQQFTKRCKELDIDAVRAEFQSKACTEVPLEEWLARPPVDPRQQE